MTNRKCRFVKLAGGDKKIVEYNQEACRLHAYDGKKSLIRSFPSKVGVRACRSNQQGVGLGGRSGRFQRGEFARAKNALVLVKTTVPTCVLFLRAQTFAKHWHPITSPNAHTHAHT